MQLRKLKFWLFGIFALAFLLAPKSSLAADVVYYFKDSSKGTIVAQGGFYSHKFELKRISQKEGNLSFWAGEADLDGASGGGQTNPFTLEGCIIVLQSEDSNNFTYRNPAEWFGQTNPCMSTDLAVSQSEVLVGSPEVYADAGSVPDDELDEAEKNKPVTGKWIDKDTIRYDRQNFKRHKQTNVFIREDDTEQCKQSGGKNRRIIISDSGLAGNFRVFSYDKNYDKESNFPDCKPTGEETYITLSNSEVVTGDVTGDSPCAVQAGALQFIICPLLKIGREAVDFMVTSVIAPLLEFRPLDENQANLKSVWTAIRNLANVFFVLIFLVIVFANTLSLKLDAYTIKKSLPRLVIAVILVQFSYLIAGFVVDIGNVLGQGISGLIAETIKSPGVAKGGDPGTMLSVMGLGISGLIGGLIIAKIGIAMAMLFLASGLLSALGAVLVLVVRHLFIAVMIVISPIAFAAWVLPNTEQFFQFWIKNFTRAILMYPIIMLLFAVAQLLSATAQNTNGTTANTVLSQILAGSFPIVAFFMIPMTFSMAGTALGKLTGITLGKAGSMGKNLRKGRLGKDLQETKQRERFIKYGQARTGSERAFRAFQAGGLIPTQASRRRLGKGYFSALDEQTKAGLGQIKLANSGAGLSHSGGVDSELGMLIRGQSVGGVRSNPETQAAALSILAKNQQWGTINDLADMRTSGGVNVNPQVWSQGLDDTDVWKKAPTAMMGNKAFGTITSEKIKEMDFTTARRMMTYGASNPAAQRQILNAISNLANDPGRGKVDNKTLGEISHNLHLIGSSPHDAGLKQYETADPAVDGSANRATFNKP